MTDDTTFELTLERIALIRRLVVAWDETGSGAPMIHPDAPYGSTDRAGDIENVTGDDEGLEEEHRAVGDALEVFVRNAALKPGLYQYHNPLAKLTSARVVDLFRDDATGVTPEQISFEVTPEHLRLVPALNLRWDGGNDVPGVDPDRPYGGSAAYTARMAALIGGAEAGSAELSDEQDARMTRLHREMQPVLQIFLRTADLAPGAFRREGADWLSAD